MDNKILLTLSFLISSLLWSQNTTVLFQDSFEDYQDWTYSGIGVWTLKDLDGEPQMGIAGVNFPNNTSHPFAAKIVNRSTATANLTQVNIPDYRNYDANTGEKALGMFASLLPPNNDWIISPKVQLGSSGNKLSFYVKATHMNNEKYEKFRVLISTTDTDPQNFTALPQVYNGSHFTNSQWTKFVIDLDAYNNMEVYVAINYITEFYDDPTLPPPFQKGGNCLLLDDFTISTQGLLGTKDIVKDKKTKVYPNPFKENLSLQSDEKIQNIKVFDISGRFVFKKEISAYKKEINLSFLKPGVYSIEIQKPEATEHIKVIKEE